MWLNFFGTKLLTYLYPMTQETYIKLTNFLLEPLQSINFNYKFKLIKIIIFGFITLRI